MASWFRRVTVGRVDPDDRLSMVEHLTELRKRLFIAVITLAAAFAVLYVFNEWLLDLLLDPLAPEYRTLLADEIDASLASAPGVLSLQAVFVQDAPSQIRLLEVYADEAAYLSHLQTPHFLKYNSATAHMVRDLRLLPVTPIRLQLASAKP